MIGNVIPSVESVQRGRINAVSYSHIHLFHNGIVFGLRAKVICRHRNLPGVEDLDATKTIIIDTRSKNFILNLRVKSYIKTIFTSANRGELSCGKNTDKKNTDTTDNKFSSRHNLVSK